MAEQGFTLTSPDFVPDAYLPATVSCDSENRAPELQWMHAPEGARSFALVLEDPDAPQGTFTHWLLYDIPATAEGLKRGGEGIGVAGRNDFQELGFGGPCPPPNHGDHRYVFRLFALDVDTLDLPAGAKRDEVWAAVNEHAIDQCELMGRFERTTGQF